MKQYEIKSLTPGLGSPTPVIIEAGSPTTAVTKYCKNFNISVKPVKLTTKIIEELMNRGLDNMQIASIPSLLVDLIDSANPISSNSTFIFIQ
jgi:hypothetical protein